MYSFRLDLTALAIIIASLTLSTPWASAQSQSDLRRENQRLRTEVSDLQRALEAAQQRIQELEAEIEQLRETGSVDPRAPGGITPGDPEPVTIDESIPTASPRALLRELKARYREQLGEMPVGIDEADPERIAYMRALRHWIARVNREFRQPINWFVTLQSDARPRNRGFIVQAQAVDPETGYKLGEQFPVFLPRALANRLQQRDYDWQGVLAMSGVLVPRVQIDPERADEGVFNSPPFIGSFVEFEMAAEARTLLPKGLVLEEDEDEDQEDDDADDADGGG